MELKLKNLMLVPTHNFLQKLELKGKQSRARTKLTKLIYDQVATLSDSEVTLADEYGQTNADGKIIRNDNGMALISEDKLAEYNKEHTALLNETAEINGATYTEHLDDCRKFLEEYDQELSGKDADVYDNLLDAIEEQEKEGK